jgi:hypothetical protein
MKVGRLSSLVVVAALALGLAAASTALAALPEFTPTGASVTGSGGAGVLRGGENAVTCEKNVIVGGPTVRRFLIGPFRIHFLGCSSTGATKAGCAVSSTGQSSGLILTNTLHIVPVLFIYPSKRHTTSDLLLPVAGKEFTKLAANECTKETAVTGNLVGAPLPVGRATTKAAIDFNAVEEENALKEEAVYESGEGNGEYKGVTAFSVSATDAQTECIEFSSATELT